MNKTGAIKPYNIVVNEADNSAEINMYGEVVAQHPVDWWTGEPVPGDFIALDDFLRDLDELGTKDHVTVHINSIGGDLYAGLAIYNRLKSLSGDITTINDSLAASAASIIFMAGNTRKVHAGSSLMIHEAAGFLYGYYQSKDLKDAMKQLDAYNKAAAAAYAEATGKDADSIRNAMAKETWMTGQEAVDAGYADEVISDSVPITMSLTHDKRFIVSNGVAMSTRSMSNIPAGIPVLPAKNIVSPAAPAPVEDKNKPERSTDMEIKNIEELRAAFPDLLAQAEAAAREDGRTAGVTEERARIKGIEAIQGAIADQAMIAGAKYGEKPLTAEQLALQAMQAQAAIGAKVLNNIAQDGAESGANGVTAAPNAGPEGQEEDPVDTKKEITDAVNLFNKLMGGKK